MNQQESFSEKKGPWLLPLPQGEKSFEGYRVWVNSTEASLYSVRVSALPFNRVWPGHQRDVSQSEEAALLSFDMESPVEITVALEKEVKTAVLRPLNAKITPILENASIRFVIDRPGQYSLEMDGRHHNLHIFANPPAKKVKKEDYTHYFSAGVHEVGELVLHSGDRVYLEAGAVVYGAIQAYDAQNITVEGRGIWDYSRLERQEPFRYEKTGIMNWVRCRNVTLDGIILRDSSWWTVTCFNCSEVEIRNVKCVGMWRYNSDGFDFVCCQNVHVDGCFLRNFDDVIVFKGYSLADYNLRVVSPEGKESPPYNLQNNENCLVENCVIWCDWGGALEIGAETATDEYVNLTFRNCDIIHSSHGAMRINCTDRAQVHHLLYEDIRVEFDGYEQKEVIQRSEEMSYPEDLPYEIPGLIYGWMRCGKYSANPRLGNVFDVVFRNVHAKVPQGLPCPAVEFTGQNEEHGFWDIRLEGFLVNGSPALSLKANEFTRVQVVE